MAKKETNEAKREEMKAICAAALAAGWTAPVLAAYFGHSSFSPFVNGKSMGTNTLRREIAELPAFSLELVKARIADLERWVAENEADRARQMARPDGGFLFYIDRAAKSHAARLKVLRNAVAGKMPSIKRAAPAATPGSKGPTAVEKEVLAVLTTEFTHQHDLYPRVANRGGQAIHAALQRLVARGLVVKESAPQPKGVFYVGGAFAYKAVK